jgi:hypothetical protein
VVVLRFRARQDEDLLDAWSYWSSQSVEFRKAPPVNSTWHHMPGDCWLGWDSVVRTIVFSDRLVSEGAWRSSIICCHYETRLLSMVKSETKNDMEAKFLMTSSGGSSFCGNGELAS